MQRQDTRSFVRKILSHLRVPLHLTTIGETKGKNLNERASVACTARHHSSRASGLQTLRLPQFLSPAARTRIGFSIPVSASRREHAVPALVHAINRQSNSRRPPIYFRRSQLCPIHPLARVRWSILVRTWLVQHARDLPRVAHRGSCSRGLKATRDTRRPPWRSLYASRYKRGSSLSRRYSPRDRYRETGRGP